MEEHEKKPALYSDARMKVRPLAFLVVFVAVGVSAVPVHAEDCVPSCRDGYLCHEGACIEACNPPCGAGEQCVGGGECVAQAPSDPAYTPVTTTGGSATADAGGKPSVALPATFVGIGGFFLIAGGVTFGTSEWDGYYGEYWGTGQWVGVGLMTMGAIMLVTATPFLAIRAKEKRDWERQHTALRGGDLTFAPILAPAARHQRYGLSLRGRF